MNIKALLAAATMVSLPMVANATVVSPDASNTLIDGGSVSLPGAYDYTANLTSEVVNPSDPTDLTGGVDTEIVTVSFQLTSAVALALNLDARSSTLEQPDNSIDMTRVALTTGEDFAGSLIKEFSIADFGGIEFAQHALTLTAADFGSGVWFSVSATNVTETQQLSAQVRATVAPVPVPAGILLMGTAIAGFGVMRRRKKTA